jgi:hypothetical protein
MPPNLSFDGPEIGNSSHSGAITEYARLESRSQATTGKKTGFASAAAPPGALKVGPNLPAQQEHQELAKSTKWIAAHVVFSLAHRLCTGFATKESNGP